MLYEFKSFHIYPTKFDTLVLEESTSFKPVFHILTTLFDNVEIFCGGELVWRVSKYGEICYVVRYFNGHIFARYTLRNEKLQGHTYIYSQEYLKFILHYDHNNLHGKQFSLDNGTTVIAEHGRINNIAIKDIHKIACDLLKWV